MISLRIKGYFIIRQIIIFNDISFTDGLTKRSSYGDTPVHEVFHSLGLFHTFYEANFNIHFSLENQRFMFKIYSTCNTMDYVSERNYLYKWQWDLIRQEIQ